MAHQEKTWCCPLASERLAPQGARASLAETSATTLWGWRPRTVVGVLRHLSGNLGMWTAVRARCKGKPGQLDSCGPVFPRSVLSPFLILAPFLVLQSHQDQHHSLPPLNVHVHLAFLVIYHVSHLHVHFYQVTEIKKR